MPDSDVDRPQMSQPSKASTATRVDPAHVVADLPKAEHAGERPELTLAAVAPPAMPLSEQALSEQALEQVRMQAAQLGGHLQRQQRSLDHRESEVNARLAAVDNEIRGARLWLAERHETLANRMADLAEQERELEFRQAESAQGHAQLNERERQIAAREAALDERLNAVSTAEATSYQARTAAQTKLDAKIRELAARADKHRELQRQMSELESRRQNLETAEALLAQQQAALIAERQQLAQRRAAFDDDAQKQRRKVALDERRVALELEAQRQLVEGRGEQIDARRAALAQLRVEVVRAQRETMEMRLATEELWARLQGSAAPASLTQSLVQLRLKLADQNRLALAEISEQKAELQALAAKISGQHDALARQRSSLQQWAVERQQEIETQAAALALRERELDDEHHRLGELEARWQTERYEYQQEIRRLLRHLRRGNPIAA